MRQIWVTESQGKTTKTKRKLTNNNKTNNYTEKEEEIIIIKESLADTKQSQLNVTKSKQSVIKTRQYQALTHLQLNKPICGIKLIKTFSRMSALEMFTSKGLSSLHLYSSSSSSSSSSSRILMSCQSHRVTSGQSNSGHKQIHISKLFSHIYQPSVKSVYKTNHFTDIKHTYTNIRHKFSKS